MSCEGCISIKQQLQGQYNRVKKEAAAYAQEFKENMVLFVTVEGWNTRRQREAIEEGIPFGEVVAYYPPDNA